jgi:mRNA deadenylase 3'-5' endonuclease subunit Ccr4
MRKVHPQSYSEYEGGSKFKIMSYNILADRLMLRNATHLLPKDPCHDPEYRMNRILAEIE